MESIEKRLHSLTNMIRELKEELDSLEVSGHRPLSVHLSIGLDGGKVAHPADNGQGSEVIALAGLELERNLGLYQPNNKVIMISSDHNESKLLEMTSMGKGLKRLVAPLTHREIDILKHIADGNTNKEIAYILGISEHTIKNHVSAILRKLGANDRTHAVSIAISRGWLSVARKE
jgi:DNA-binding CsgD family transcriptional regulator